MLTVLRKHQKIFVVIVGFFIVASFLFFGVLSRGRLPSRVPDVAVGKAVDGSDVMQSHMVAMARYISADCLDGHLASVRQVPNFFNDGVIRNDLLGTGLAQVIGERYFEELKDDIKLRHKRMQTFKPYAHPQMPFLSVNAVWSQFTPQLPGKVDALKGMEFSPSVFGALVDVYTSQGGMNSELVRQMLNYQQRLQGVQDPHLAQRDLSLVGAHSLEDWFGPKFIEKCSSIVINGARLAEQKGYRVSLEEARADMMLVGYHFLSAKQDEKPTSNDVAEYFEKQLQYLGLNEKSALGVWRDVMLFRRLFNEAGTVFVDPLVQKGFDAYAHDGVKVRSYRLPAAVRDHQAELGLYLERVANKTAGLPDSTRNLNEIDGRLLEECFEVEMAAINKFNLLENVTLKEMLKYELDADHWGTLKMKFPQLQGTASTRAERLAKLDALNGAARDPIDAYAREKVLDLHPEWIEEALNEKELETKTLRVAKSGDNEPLPGITHLEAFTKLLKEESENLSGFTDDQEHYYRIVVKAQSKGPRLLTFTEALESKTLEKMLSAEVQRRYSAVQSENAQFKDKPWHAVKDEVAHLLYAKPLQARLKKHVETRPSYDGFGKQWELEASSQHVKRSDDHWFLPNELKDGLMVSKQGDPIFISIEGKSDLEFPTAEYVKATCEELSREVKKTLLDQLLVMMDDV